MSDLGNPDGPREDRPRGALAQFGSDALGDLGDELKLALLVVVFVGVGAAVGFAVAQGEGAVIGGIVGAGVLGLVGAVVLLKWAWDLARGARQRLRSR